MLYTIGEIVNRFRTEGACYKFKPNTISYMAKKLGYSPKKIGGKIGYDSSLMTAISRHFKDAVEYDKGSSMKTSQRALKQAREGDYYTYNGERDNVDYDWEKNESFININKLITETINEYLDTMTSNAMRSLGTTDSPSDLAKQTHRYLQKDLFNPVNGKIGLNKNSWLIHITTQDVGYKIMKEGFKSCITDLNFRATQDIEVAKELSSSGLCFSCQLDDDDNWYGIVQQMKDYDEEWCGVIFQANGFNAWSAFGEKNEVIFNANSAHNFLLLLPMTDNEKEQYLQYNSNNIEDLEYFEGVKVVDKNGKTLMKGDMESLFHVKVINNNGRYEGDQKMKSWLNNNQTQYRHKFGNK